MVNIEVWRVMQISKSSTPIFLCLALMALPVAMTRSTLSNSTPCSATVLATCGRGSGQLGSARETGNVQATQTQAEVLVPEQVSVNQGPPEYGPNPHDNVSRHDQSINSAPTPTFKLKATYRTPSPQNRLRRQGQRPGHCPRYAARHAPRHPRDPTSSVVACSSGTETPLTRTTYPTSHVLILPAVF